MLSGATDISFCEYTLIFLRCAHFIFFFEIKKLLKFLSKNNITLYAVALVFLCSFLPVFPFFAVT